MIHGALDIGTNSVKLHLAEREADGSWTPRGDRVVITRLGENLHATGRLSDAAMERTARAVAALAAEARAAGAVRLVAAGTMGMREAANGRAFARRLAADCGLEVEILEPAEEARLAFLAAAELAGFRPALVFDAGGGSTELIRGRGAALEEAVSLDLGVRTLTDRHLRADPAAPAEIAAVRGEIDDRLSGLTPLPAPAALIGIGGVVTTLVAVEHRMTRYEPDAVHGRVLARAEVTRQIEIYRTLTLADRRELAGLDAERADVILAGALLVEAILARTGRTELTASDRGLRHGLLRARFAADA